MTGFDGQRRENFPQSVDNLLLIQQVAEKTVQHLNWLFPTASPARTPAEALSSAGGLSGNPGKCESMPS